MNSEHKRPLVRDVGKRSRKAVKRMRRGEGKVIEEAVAAAAQAMKAKGEDPSEAIAVVLLYEKKSKKRVQIRLSDFLRL